MKRGLPYVIEALSKTLPELSNNQLENLLETPKKFGDFALPCFSLAKIYKKDPKIIAEEIASNIELPSFFDKVESAGPYVNFYINSNKLTEEVIIEVLSKKEKYGISNIGEDKTAVFDYSSPNIGKPLHIGHIRSTILGDSIINLLKFAGYKTHGINYIGDTGLHLGKLLIAIDRYGDLEKITNNPETELLELYVRYGKVESEQIEEQKLLNEAYLINAAQRLFLDQKSKEYDLSEIVSSMTEAIIMLEDSEAQGESLYYSLRGLNPNLVEQFDREQLISIFDSYYNKAPEEPEILQSARKILREIENKAPNRIEILKKIQGWSMQAFNRVYSLLDLEFDEIIGQSNFSERGKELVSEAFTQRIARYGETGELIINLEELTNGKLPNKVILKSDGTPLYVTQDMGAAYERFKKWDFDRMIYITAKEQDTYFEQLFKILDLLGFDWAKNCEHYGFGLINLEEGKMSTREGRVILLEDVLTEASVRAKKEIDERIYLRELPVDLNRDELAKQIGISAVKYAILKVQHNKDINFSWKDTLSFEGDASPYIQYTYARAHSILRKSNEIKEDFDSDLLIEPAEIELVKEIGDFPNVIEQNVNSLEISSIARYASDLATLFNKFYRDCPVLSADTSELMNSRLALVKSYTQTMKNVMHILGIAPIEHM